jgi:bifunctional non-homologous end joining protein LigD
VSTPVTWDEVKRTLKKKDAGLLVFESAQTIARFEKMGDLFEPVLELKQKLPNLKAAAVAKEPVEIAAQADKNDPDRKTASKKSAKKPAARKKRAKV